MFFFQGLHDLPDEHVPEDVPDGGTPGLGLPHDADAGDVDHTPALLTRRVVLEKEGCNTAPVVCFFLLAAWQSPKTPNFKNKF